MLWKKVTSLSKLWLNLGLSILCYISGVECVNIHPARLTWNLQITHLERKMIFQTSMIMFQPFIYRGVPFIWIWVFVYLHWPPPTPISPRFFSSKLTNPRKMKWVSRRRVGQIRQLLDVIMFYVKFRRKHPRNLTICYQQLPCLKLSYLFQPIILGIHVSFRRCSTVCLLSWLSPCFSILGGYGSSFAIPTNLWFLLP